jgi:photosystem II stability/assembly factor-like uncharacterized protein
MKIFATLLLASAILLHGAESPRVFLAGKDARLLSVLPLSDGTILAGGSVANLEWLPAGVPRIELPAESANGWKLPVSEGDDASRRAVLLHLSADLGKVLAVAAFPAGRGGGTIAAIKTDAIPGKPTGGVFLAGSNTDQTKFWIGKLDANFLEARPSKLAWGYDKGLGNIGKLPLDAIWDVGGDGKVVFYNYPKRDWGVVCRLKADGSGIDSVPEWRNSHGATQPDGSEAKTLSLKTGSGDLRSKTWEEFEAITPDGHGGFRKGSFPDDLYFSQPLEAGNAPRGYTGYSSRNNAATTACIAVDRRTNAIFLGYNVQSILPPWSDIPNAPDFEPALAAFDSNGHLRWWSRMYSEINEQAGPFVSSDAGKTWSHLGKGFVFGAAHGAAMAGETIFVAENSGVSRLQHGGPWVTSSKDISALPVTAIASGDKDLFIGTARSGILKSSDGGGTWVASRSGIPDGKNDVVAMAIHPQKPPRLYAAIDRVGLFVSEDNGKQWAPTAGALRSKDLRDLAFSPANPDTLFALAADGLFKTTDGGATWTELKVPGNNFTSLAVAPDDPNTLFVGSDNKKDKDTEGIRVSTDGGQTWREEKVGNRRIAHVVCLPGSTDVLCASFDRGIFKRGASADHNDWTRLAQAPGLEGATGGFNRLLADPKKPGTVYAFSQGAGYTSTPDQYVDAVAVDYSKPAEPGEVVVMARSHGNNVSNYWSGKEGGSFMRRQTGTKGNEHYQWIARFGASNGTFINATWLAGLDPFSSNFGKPYEDPNLAGWPDYNGGNANLKGAQGHSLGVAADGKVFVAGTTRGGITTANAFQKMTSPLEGKSPWHDFFRVHSADLSTVTYATALTGMGWDTQNGEGAGNTRIAAVAALPKGGFVVVGSHDGTGNTIPTSNVPSWGKSAPEGETIMLGIFPESSTP